MKKANNSTDWVVLKKVRMLPCTELTVVNGRKPVAAF